MIVLLCLAVQAHTGGQSNSHWSIQEGSAEVRVRVSARDADTLVRSLDSAADLVSLLPRGVLLSVDGRLCTPSPAHRLAALEGWLRYSWSLRCPPGRDLQLEAPLLTGLDAGHLHLVSLERAGQHHALVLSAAQPVWPQATPSPGERRGWPLLLIGGLGLLGLALRRIWPRSAQ